MISWIDIAMILLSCTAANHLGLIGAIEQKTGIELPVVNCARCFSFWCTLLYMFVSENRMVVSFAVSFINSYLAIWLELGMGYIDYLYNKCYDKIYNASDDTPAADADKGNSDGSVSNL